MLNWTKEQWDAIGRHVLTALGSGLAVAVALNLTTAAKAGELLAQTTNFITALFGLIAVLAPIYAALRAGQSASPDNQAKQTVKNLEQGVPLNGEKDKLIAAVANQPEVAKVEMVIPEKAQEIPSAKVV